MNEVDDRRLEEAIGAWEQRRVWISLVIVSALLAIVYPIANFFGAPHGTEPLRLRLIVAAVAIVFCLPTVFFPRLRRYARALLAIEIVAFYAIQGTFLAATQFSPYVVTRAVLVISAVPLVAPTILDVELALGTFAITALTASAIQGSMQMERISGPFGTILLACIIAGAVGVAAIESRRRGVRALLAAELDLEERLALLKTRDPLTGLLNTARFTDLCEDAIDSAYIRGARFSIVVIDLDHLPDIDRQYGIRIANAVVMEFAHRLKSSARNPIVARIRSERFAAIAVDADAQRADEVAYAMLESLVEPFRVNGDTIYVTGTAGIAVYPEDGRTVDALLARTDDNVRRARGGIHDAEALASEKAEPRLMRLRELHEDLHHALADGQLRLYFQPCVESRSGRPITAEALMRWEHPKYGTILPAEFIPLLEFDGTIDTVGEWALREAARLCSQWRRSREIGVSVNVSLEQFRDAALCARVRSALDQANLPAYALTLELTETVAMQNIDYTLRTMNLTRSWGVKYALDDFGIGYSSMAHLRELPIDEIKIDRSFVEGLPGNRGDAAIVRALISLAHTLGSTIYAEGVEHTEQAHWLAGEGCDALQGLLVSPPLPAPEFEAWLESTAPQNRSN